MNYIPEILKGLKTEWFYLLAVLIGSILRLYQLSLQIISDDEWHSLYAALTRAFPRIVTHFGLADYCIPLALFYHFCFLTVGLSETVMRFPVIFFGFLSLCTFPLIVRPLVNRSASDAFAWLIAICPLHIYYSRYARPYSIVFFLSFVGLVAFFYWVSRGNQKGRWIYVLCAILAPYFHLSAILFLSSLMVVAVITALYRGRLRLAQGPDLKEATLTGLIIAIMLVILLGPPLFFDWNSLSSKTADGFLTLETLTGALQLVSGSQYPLFQILFAVGIMVGGASILKHRPLFATLVLFVIGIQVSLLLFTLPTAVQVPIVFVRYLLPVIPVLLLCFAVSIRSVGQFFMKHWLHYPQRAIPVIVFSGFFFWGPVPTNYQYPNNWTNHGLFQYFYDSSNKLFSYSNILKPARISEFYQHLASLPEASITILEAPWYYEWHNNNFPYYQRVHRQKMLVGFVASPGEPVRNGEWPVNSRGFKFVNFLHVSDLEQIRERKIDFVVFHKNLRDEIPNAAYREPENVDHWIAFYRDQLGSPVFEDEQLTVFSTGNSTATGEAGKGHNPDQSYP